MAVRILVVEDDKHVRRILEQLLVNEPSLKPLAAEVVQAGDGEQGMKELAKGPFDLVITDLLMPRMDGFVFCRELRKHRYGAQVPVIVTSAIYKDTPSQIRLGKEVGEHQFFAKPYEIRDLVQAVHRIFDGNPAPEPALEVAPPLPRSEVSETGSLGERPAARLFLDLAERKATGTLTLVRGKVKKEIGIVNGILVSCDSNLRTETLGHFLISRGVLDEKRHQAALTRAQTQRELLGQALIELGWISQKDLLHQLAAQMRAKIAGTLRWHDGDWRFAPGAPPERLQTPIEAALLVFLGLQKTAHVDEIAQQLAGAHGRLSLTPRAERHRDTFARVFGVAALEAIARRPRLADLMAGTDPAAMLAQLDALLSTGLAELKPDDSPPPLSPAPEADPDFGPSLELVSETPPDPVALERLSQPPQPAQPPRDNLYDGLFGDEPSEVRPPSNETQPPDAEAFRKEILTEYLALRHRNYYEILGVPRDASTEVLAEAYASLRERFRLERFSSVDLGRDYAHVETLHQSFQRAWDTLTTHRAQYDRSLLEADDPSPSPIDAELLSHEAEALLAAGEAERARAKLEQAVAAAPDIAHHRAQLGWATFVAAGDADVRAAAAAARPHLEQALAIDRDDREAHELLGRILAAAGDDDGAIVHLERALDVQPAAGPLTPLEAIYTRRGAWKLLERRYRKLIHRLGEGRDPLRLHLWERLAELYLSRLGDRESARVAYEVLTRLVPDEPRFRQAATQLGAAPAQPPEARFAAHLAAQEWDAAFVAAAVAQAPPASEAAGFYRRYQPRFLQRAAPIELEQLSAQRHPDDDPDLGQLLHRVFTAQPPAFSLGDLGVTDEDRIDLLPSPFRRALGHASALFGMEPPPIYRRGDLGFEISPGAAQPPVLLAGPQALANSDLPHLAFRLARALSYLPWGHAVAVALPLRQLRESLLAGLELVSPQLRVDDSDGAVARLHARLAQSSPSLAVELAPFAERLLRNPQLHQQGWLARFLRGIGRTADRMGLLACHDPAVALTLTSAPDDLAAWALSDGHLSLRQQLGITVAV